MAEGERRLDVNDELAVMANCGIYQWIILIITGFLTGLFAMHMFIPVFNHGDPMFRCAHPNAAGLMMPNTTCNTGADNFNSTTGNFNSTDCGNATTTVAAFDNQCTFVAMSEEENITQLCKNFEYDTSLYPSSIVADFDLVCDRVGIATVVDTSWMVSESIGTLIGSIISDRFGRKKMIVIAFVIMGVFGTAAAFAQDVVTYTVLRCIMGTVCFAGFSATIALVTETTAPNKRAHAVNGCSMFWVVGSLLLPLLAYLIPNWRYLQGAISIPPLIIGIICIWLIDESPHWLMTRNDTQGTVAVLKKMAAKNRIEIYEVTFKAEDKLSEPEPEPTEDKEEVPKENLCMIWRYPRLLARFLVFSFGTAVCSFCYYTLSLGVAMLPGSLYVNMVVLSIAEALAYVGCFIISYVGRKWTTVACFFGGALTLLGSTLCMALAKDNGAATAAFAYLGKFFVSASWQILFIWGTELYPTNYRCMLTCLNGIVGRIGTILAPIMLDLHKLVTVPHINLVVPIVFTTLMFGAAFLHMIPPDTKNRKLPETMKEANQPQMEMALDLSKLGDENKTSDEESVSEEKL